MLDRLRKGSRFVVGVSKGVARGDIFPAAGRQPPRPAPNGSSEPQRPAGPFTRAREENAWFTETRHSLEVKGLQRPLSVLHLTDVHLRRAHPWVDQLCQALQELEPPDLVVLTGDIVGPGWKPEAVRRFLQALPPAPLGRFAIMGNWEYWSGAEPGPWRRMLAEHGVQLLIDQQVELGPLVLVGTDDVLAGEPDLQRALSGRSPGQPTLVLTHSPALFDEIARPDVDLVLAGHSHAGQVRLPLLGAAWVPMGTGSYIGGWYSRSGSHLFVSRGIGWSIAPLRMWCSPELARITLLPGVATSPSRGAGPSAA